MTTDILIVFATVILSAACFVWGKVRSDIVALCALTVLVLSGILTPEEGLAGFSNSVVIMMACLFIVGGGIFQTGLARMISSRILALAGGNERKLFLLVMLTTGGIGAFVSNTGTVALMLPIVMSLAAEAQTRSRRYLMPMAFASSLGLFTLISTPPNLIINDTLAGGGYEPLGFFSFLPVGAVTLGLGIALLWPLSKLLTRSQGRPDEAGDKAGGKSLKQLAGEYRLADNLYRIRVEGGSPFAGQSLQALGITQKYNTSVVEIRRTVSQHRFHRTVDMTMAGPGNVLREGDMLYVVGDFADVQRLVDDNGLSLVDVHQSESNAARPVAQAGGMDFGEIGIAEVVLLSSSKLVNKPVKESGFRQLYNLNILGIQRKQQYLLQGIKDVKMQAGDVLLVQGRWSDIAKLSGETAEWVVAGNPMETAAKVPLDRKAPVAAAIMVLMVVAMVAEWLPAVMCTLLAALLMILTGCFRNVEAAYKTINWESIFLFAGMFPLATAMDKTGASALVASGIVSGLGDLGPMVVLAGIYAATSLLTMFISNTATAVLFAPIAIQAALALGVSPYPFLLCVTVAASMCFASPFSTPPNALVMSAGRYKFSDYIRVGLPLQLAVGVVMVFVLPLLFPF